MPESLTACDSQVSMPPGFDESKNPRNRVNVLHPLWVWLPDCYRIKTHFGRPEKKLK